MEYTIAHSYDPDELIYCVNALIERGFRPWGYVIASSSEKRGTLYAQAMLKVDENEMWPR